MRVCIADIITSSYYSDEDVIQKLDELEEQINNSDLLTPEQKEALISRISAIRRLFSETIRAHTLLDAKIAIDTSTRLDSKQLTRFLEKHTIQDPKTMGARPELCSLF